MNNASDMKGSANMMLRLIGEQIVTRTMRLIHSTCIEPKTRKNMQRTNRRMLLVLFFIHQRCVECQQVIGGGALKQTADNNDKKDGKSYELLMIYFV